MLATVELEDLRKEIDHARYCIHIPDQTARRAMF